MQLARTPQLKTKSAGRYCCHNYKSLQTAFERRARQLNSSCLNVTHRDTTCGS